MLLQVGQGRVALAHRRRDSASPGPGCDPAGRPRSPDEPAGCPSRGSRPPSSPRNPPPSIHRSTGQAAPPSWPEGGTRRSRQPGRRRRDRYAHLGHGRLDSGGAGGRVDLTPLWKTVRTSAAPGWTRRLVDDERRGQPGRDRDRARIRNLRMRSAGAVTCGQAAIGGPSLKRLEGWSWAPGRADNPVGSNARIPAGISSQAQWPVFRTSSLLLGSSRLSASASSASPYGSSRPTMIWTGVCNSGSSGASAARPVG